MSEFGALVVGTAAMGVALAGVAVSPLWEPILLAMVAGGIANGLIEVAETTIVQVRTPDEVRSRVIAASEACVLVAFGVSFLVGGPLVDAVGPQPVYASGAVGCVLGALMLATLRGQPVRRPAVLEPSRLG
jgi:predicted MFS family arabinose efflux permease